MRIIIKAIRRADKQREAAWKYPPWTVSDILCNAKREWLFFSARLGDSVASGQRPWHYNFSFW